MKIKLTVLFFLLTCAISGSAQSLNIPLLTVNETEVTYAAVDEIHFTIIIQSHAKEIDDARDKNRKVAESIFKYLDKKKIPKRYVQSRRMRISRNYIRNRVPVEYDGFNAYQEIYVCLKDIKMYDEIVDGLLVMDIQSLKGPEFKSSVYEETLEKARLKALKNARKSADEMAAALGQKIGKAKLVKMNSSNNSSNLSYSTQAPATVNSQSSASSFEVGEIQIIASVEVSFELLD